MLIPFLHDRSAEDASLWLSALNEALAEVKSGLKVCAIDQLTSDERAAARVAIVANPSPEALDVLPNLEWVQSLWAGVEKLLPVLADKNITLVRMIDPQLTETMAEAVLAWTLYLHRNMPAYARQQARREWRQHELPLASEQTILMLGLGQLGMAAALRLRANGFNVIGWSRSPKTVEGIGTFHGEDGFREATSRADIIISLLPSTPETKGLIGQETLGGFKRGASIINFGRSAVIDHAALIRALDEDQITHAVLDVFDIEPLPQDDPLWTHPKITVLPHISSPTNRTTASRVVARNIEAYLTSGIIPEGVDAKRGY